jgi:copper(I)-binding protein
LLLAPGVAAAQVTVEQPWSRAAPAGATGAGYMVLRNAGVEPDRLLGAETPAARRVELHTMMRDGDVMRMRHADAIAVPPGGAVALAPGGLHLMLIGLTRPLRVGERVPVTLRFERAGAVPVELVVESAGARGPGAQRH